MDRRGLLFGSENLMLAAYAEGLGTCSSKFVATNTWLRCSTQR